MAFGSKCSELDPKLFHQFLAHPSTTFAILHCGHLCSMGAFRVDRRASSVRRRPSCVLNNSFKHLLLNCWANLDQASLECSLGSPL